MQERTQKTGINTRQEADVRHYGPAFTLLPLLFVSQRFFCQSLHSIKTHLGKFYQRVGVNKESRTRTRYAVRRQLTFWWCITFIMVHAPSQNRTPSKLGFFSHPILDTFPRSRAFTCCRRPGNKPPTPQLKINR